MQAPPPWKITLTDTHAHAQLFYLAVLAGVYSVTLYMAVFKNVSIVSFIYLCILLVATLIPQVYFLAHFIIIGLTFVFFCTLSIYLILLSVVLEALG